MRLGSGETLRRALRYGGVVEIRQLLEEWMLAHQAAVNAEVKIFFAPTAQGSRDARRLAVPLRNEASQKLQELLVQCACVAAALRLTLASRPWAMRIRSVLSNVS